MAAKTTKTNMSVTKTIKLIEILAQSPEPMRLSDLAALAEIPASTTLRMVSTLVECGYAYQEDGNQQRYGLTMRFLQIGQILASHFSIRDIAHPYLIALSREVGESCCLSVREGNVIRYVDVIESSRNSNIVIRQREGGTALMHCTGSGKVFLAQYSPQELDRYIASEGLPSLTARTITAGDELQYTLQGGRERGYFMDDEECEIGMRCIAAPVLDVNGRAIAAISLSGPISRMTKVRCEVELAPKLCTYAQEISSKVCGVKKGKEDE